MAVFQGFSLSHVNEKFTENGKISTECLSINIENTGEQTVLISIKESTVKYKLEAGDSISFPENGNVNPLLVLGDWYSIDFVGAGTKEVLSTKCYASPKMLNF